jgi:hypothetical protein
MRGGVPTVHRTVTRDIHGTLRQVLGGFQAAQVLVKHAFSRPRRLKNPLNTDNVTFASDFDSGQKPDAALWFLRLEVVPTQDAGIDSDCTCGSDQHAGCQRFEPAELPRTIIRGGDDRAGRRHANPQTHTGKRDERAMVAHVRRR